MVKISRKVEYALMVLKYMVGRASEDNLICARQICDQFDIPFDTTAKVMQQMGQAQLLKAIKGVKGGYFIDTDLHQVTYSQLVDCIEGPRGGSASCDGPECNLYSKCNITVPIRRLGSMLDDFFGKITLHELLAETQFEHKGI